MVTRKLSLVVGLMAGLLTFASVSVLRAGEKPVNPDEELLREAKVGTDGPGLLAFFRERTPADEDLLHPERLVRQLGNPSFEKREEASRTLIRLERLALPLVRRAMADDDPEVGKRAKGCVTEIRQRLLRSVPLAAVRLLRERRPEGAVEALLRYLPLAPDEETEEEIWYAVEAFTAAGKAHPALLPALKDPLPARRALAACLVAQRGDEQERGAARKLLGDPEPMVCLRAAQGLLAARDKQGIPALIALLGEPDVAVSWQAEELLHYAAGDTAPPETVGAATVPARTKCRAAWEAWWKKAGERLDLRALDQAPRHPSLVLVCGARDEGAERGRVCLFGCRGPARWQLCSDWEPRDVQLLPGNQILLAEYREKKGNRLVERHLEGEVVMEQERAVERCRRLPSGDTFIFNARDWLVVSPEGERVLPFPDPDRDGHAAFGDARWLGNGRVVAIGGSYKDVLEMSVETGKFLHKVTAKGDAHWARIAPLHGGAFLLHGSYNGEPALWEVNGSGDVRWRATLYRMVDFLSRRNGNILWVGALSGGGQAVETAKGGTMVWKTVLSFFPVRVKTCLNLVSFGASDKAAETK
jgi:hypothetical protein